jgi:hypothetical protein
VLKDIAKQILRFQFMNMPSRKGSDPHATRKSQECSFLIDPRWLPLRQTICNTFKHPLELAATTMSDFPLQQTLETNSPLSSSVSFPEIGSIEPNL